jgi:hypothetical protein
VSTPLGPDAIERALEGEVKRAAVAAFFAEMKARGYGYSDPAWHALLAALRTAAPMIRHDALLSLAAELDREAAETSTEADAHAARGDDDAGCMASGASDAWRAAAQMARLRAQGSSSEASEAAPVPGEDLELTGGLSPAQAYMAGVKAERERCTLLLDRKRAVFCRPCDGEVCDYSGELAPASELVRGGGDG